MSNLGSDMVGREPMAFGDLVGSSLSPFDDQTIASTVSKRLESVSNREISSDDDQSSPKGMIRALAEILMPGQPAKQHYPRLASVLGISERRARSIYNGEVSRLWDDEKAALRRELANARNAVASREFAAAVVAMTKRMAAAGHPLSAGQRSVINEMVGVAA